MKRKNKPKLILVALVAAALVGWAAYAKFNQPKATVDPAVKALQDNVSKTAEDANKDFTGTNDGGGVTDTGGTTAPSASPTAPVASASGVITISSPASGSKLANGSTVSGTAKVATVQYRVKDDDYGVLTTGSLTVTNGKYSGSLSIRPRGSSGVLEIFDFNGAGNEENNVKVSVTF